jgi:RNA polymerase sigma factor (sigma-70 family)
MVMRHVRCILEPELFGDGTDQHLLQSFVNQRDQKAFTALVHRHGAMVLAVCRRVLHDWHDAEDAFQATFLVLARKAAAVRSHESLASWLHGVAYRVAMKAKVTLARRRKHERRTARNAPVETTAQAAWHELRPLLDGELARLPGRYRSPLVLCYLEGKTRDEAAQQLGWTLGMLKGRLERGRDLLRARLARRGLPLSGALLVPAMASNPVSAAAFNPVFHSTVKAAMSIAAGQTAAAGTIPVSVAGLVEGVLKNMLITKLKVAFAVVLTLGLSVAGLGWLAQSALADKGSQPKTVAGARPAFREAPKPQKEEDAIQGTWYAVKGEFNGNTVPAEDLQAMKMVIQGDRLDFNMAGEKNEPVTFKLNPTKKPKVMTVTLTEANVKKTAAWIYELDAKRLTICGSEKPGSTAPAKFAAPEGSNQFVLQLSRDKPELKPDQEAPDQKTASAAARMRSVNNLKQIALALHNYHSTYGSLPPAAIYSKDGKPLLSWRVAILPFIEQDGLYRAFHLNEPWDSTHNKKLLDQVPKAYVPVGGENKDKRSTYYQVFVGKGTIFEGKKGITFQDVPDGTSNTLLVVEAGEAVPWTKPADLSYDPKKPLPPLGGMLKDKFNVAMADGSVRAIPEKFKEATMRLLIIRNDGMPVNLDDLKP